MHRIFILFKEHKDGSELPENMMLCLSFIVLKLPWCFLVHMLHKWPNTVQTAEIIVIRVIASTSYYVISNSKNWSIMLQSVWTEFLGKNYLKFWFYNGKWKNWGKKKKGFCAILHGPYFALKDSYNSINVSHPRLILLIITAIWGIHICKILFCWLPNTNKRFHLSSESILYLQGLILK